MAAEETFPSCLSTLQEEASFLFWRGVGVIKASHCLFSLFFVWDRSPGFFFLWVDVVLVPFFLCFLYKGFRLTFLLFSKWGEGGPLQLLLDFSNLPSLPYCPTLGRGELGKGPYNPYWIGVVRWYCVQQPFAKREQFQGGGKEPTLSLGWGTCVVPQDPLPLLFTHKLHKFSWVYPFSLLAFGTL